MTEQLIVTEPVQTVLVDIAVGPQGPQGEPGQSATIYQHTQSSAASTWTIAHNLGSRPVVQSFNVGGIEILGSVQHLSDNVLVVEFVTPQAGYARLS